MDKAVGSDSDAVIFDLEDSVPIASKSEARQIVAQAIDDGRGESQGRPFVYVRVNGATTGHLAADLEAVVRAGTNAIMLPKAETIEEVRFTADEIARHENANGVRAGTVEIILQIESALGVHRCFELIKASTRVAGTCIGSARDGDLQTDLGCAWSIEGQELLFARSKVLLETRAAGAHLCPLDGVFSDLNDNDGLAADSRLSARLGYVGRTIIHPKQITTVRAAYAVAPSEVTYYRTVISEFEAAEERGVAAIVVSGKLVDYAMYQRAKRVLDLANLDR